MFKAGIRNHNVRLTVKQVCAIRAIYNGKQNSKTMRDLAKDFRTSKSNIHSITSGRTWKTLNCKTYIPVRKTKYNEFDQTPENNFNFNRPKAFKPKATSGEMVYDNSQDWGA